MTASSNKKNEAAAKTAGRTVTMTVEQLEKLRADLREEAAQRLEQKLEEQAKVRDERRKKKKAEKLRRRTKLAAQAEALARRSAEMRRLEAEAAAMCDPEAVSDEPSDEAKAIFGEIDTAGTRDQKHAAVQKLLACVCREKGIAEIRKRTPEDYRFKREARP